MDNEAFEANQQNWDDRALIHYADENGSYGVNNFKKGFNTLGSIESAEIGEVKGLDILHLQCHFGLDTLSLARLGARVTGLYFSPNAIAIACQLAAESHLEAHFIEGNVRHVRELVKSTFDMVYATWGVFCWIPDAKLWIRNAASLLNEGGRLYIADGHPITGILEETADGKELRVTRNYTTSKLPEYYEATKTYTGVDTPLRHTACYEWHHSLEEFVCGAQEAGLQIQFLHEHNAATWQRYSALQNDSDGLWRFPPQMPAVSLSFSLMASKL